MKILIKTKLLEGKYLELREYELFKQPLKVYHCASKDYKTCNHDECRFMILSLSKQKTGKITNTQQSKFPPYKYYRLYKFLFKPVQEMIAEDVSVDISLKRRLAEEFFKQHPEMRRRA